MRRARTSALILLAEIAAHADLPLASRIAVGMSRDVLLGVDEVEPLRGSDHRSHQTATIAEVAQLLEQSRASSAREAARCRVAATWLRGQTSG